MLRFISGNTEVRWLWKGCFQFLLNHFKQVYQHKNALKWFAETENTALTILFRFTKILILHI